MDTVPKKVSVGYLQRVNFLVALGGSMYKITMTMEFSESEDIHQKFSEFEDSDSSKYILPKQIWYRKI